MHSLTSMKQTRSHGLAMASQITSIDFPACGFLICDACRFLICESSISVVSCNVCAHAWLHDTACTTHACYFKKLKSWSPAEGIWTVFDCVQAVEAMLQCFCEDCERNDGSAMHPYYMPEAFKKVILDAANEQKKNKGSRMLQASIQILKACRHTVKKAVEPFVLFCIRLAARWKDWQRLREYHLVKQQSTVQRQQSLLQSQSSLV